MNKKKKVGFIFPGQGSQFLGMCKDLYDKHRVIQECFERASNCLDQNFVRLCFASSEKELRGTVNAQTSIFLVSAAICELLKNKYGVTPDIVAGHSSGEYAALFAAGGMSFPDALYLLKKRAQFMEESTRQYEGGMLAILGVPYDDLKEICDRYDKPKGKESVVEIVNYNGSKQLVVSGTLNALQQVHSDVKTFGGKVIPLNVAGAFHSRLMDDAAKQYAMYMVKVDFKDLTLPLIDNTNAKKVTTSSKLKKSLENQMNSHVQWWPSMQKLKSCDVIVEVGPSGKLSKALKREWPKKEIISVSNCEDVERLLLLLDISIAITIHDDDCDRKTCAREDIIMINNLETKENLEDKKDLEDKKR